MGDIDGALERAGWEAFMREPSKGLKARINFLLGELKTSRSCLEFGSRVWCDASEPEHRTTQVQ
ncbi:hypothetical protein ACFSL4_13635, partial [Streptomyces caeni]